MDVLDHGYVNVVDHMGTDLTPVNTARVSFMKRTDTMRPQDLGLLDFLVGSNPPHLSPFRHAIIQYEMRTPLIVARQLWRYITGAAHDEFLAYNEASMRYVSNDLLFYVPKADAWRGAPATAKQGSEGLVPLKIGLEASTRLYVTIEEALDHFEWALDNGIAPEQARLFLPANSLYTIFTLTLSLQGLAHLLTERLDSHAMWETQQFARAMRDLAYPLFPEAMGRLVPDHKPE